MCLWFDGERSINMSKIRIIISGCLCFAIVLISIIDGKITTAVSEKEEMDQVIQVTKGYYENGVLRDDKDKDTNKLPNIHDGIVSYMEMSENVMKASSSQGDKFISDDIIYSDNTYRMASAKNDFSGILIAEKDIYISGNKNSLSGGVVYSKKGDVYISGNNVILSGIIYVPNGRVVINCQNLSVRGRILCKSAEVNVAQADCRVDTRVQVWIDRLEECRLGNYGELVMYFDDESQKIGIKDISAQKINLYIRYEDEQFQRIDYKNGMKFECPEIGQYFEAYANYVDEYGEKKQTNIVTFINEGDGMLSEAVRDSDRDGIPDGYEIRDGLGNPKMIDSDGDGVSDGEAALYLEKSLGETLDMEFTVDKSTWNDMKKNGNILHKEENISQEEISCSYSLKAGDDVSVFYNKEGQKIISVYNVIQQKTRLECVDDAYKIELADTSGQILLRLGYDGENHIYNNYGYGKHGVEDIQHNGMKYSFYYDKEGRVKDIQINGSDLISTNWITDFECIKTYANGQKIITKYNEFCQPIKLSDGNEALYEWKYDNDKHGQLLYSKDYANHLEYSYQYDEHGEQRGVVCSNGFSYEIDENGRDWTVTYCYRGEKKKDHYLMKDGKYAYEHDNVQKLIDSGEKKVFYKGSLIYQLKELEGEDGTVSTDNGNEKRKYIYNSRGLLIEIWVGSDLICSYEYNNLNEMIRENSKQLDKTLLYEYDGGGNICNVTAYPLDFNMSSSKLHDGRKIAEYQYHKEFADQLVRYQGSRITYDKSGNPLTYRDGYKLTWGEGQKLNTMIANGSEVSYCYDGEGIRMRKTVDGKTTKYLYQNGVLCCEDGSKGEIWFHYDAYGTPVDFEWQDNTFFYELDEQQNVIGLLDSSGKRIVSYAYDGWGKIIDISDDVELGKLNPLRYRSYYYDEESGFYYLYNRYYDPEVKRMLNMDSYADTGFGMFSHNMYAYCENTPTNASNDTGNIPKWIESLSHSKSGENYYWKGVDRFNNTNCYGYAVLFLEVRNPGDHSHKGLKHNLDSVTENTIADLKALGHKTVKKINASQANTYSSSYEVIALRTGKTDGTWDYHYMRRRRDVKTGENFWAHKPGCAGTKLLIRKYKPGKHCPWSYEYYTNKWRYGTGGYTSSTVYLAYK